MAVKAVMVVVMLVVWVAVVVVVVETHAGCGGVDGGTESLCRCVVTDTFLSPHRMPPYNDTDYPDILENLPDPDFTNFSLDFLHTNFMKQQ